MNNGRFDNEFHRHRRPQGIFGLIFSLVSLGFNIAISVLQIFLQIFSGIANSRRDHRMASSAPINKSKPKETAEPSPKKEAAATKAESKPQEPISKEKVKETFHNQKEEHTSDWNILLFVLTLIPVIITLAMKRLDLAGLSVAAGTVIIVLYNILRNAVIASKKRKKQKMNEAAKVQKEETEIERTIKDAFNKVYAIRKELYRIPKQDVKTKIERLCNMSEKIIGEVRENPDCLNSVRKFFYYYLDAFNEVFEKYLKLYNFSDSSEEVQKLMQETEKSFDNMEEIFQEMCECMLEKDMLNLKATINVIKNSN